MPGTFRPQSPASRARHLLTSCPTVLLSSHSVSLGTVCVGDFAQAVPSAWSLLLPQDVTQLTPSLPGLFSNVTFLPGASLSITFSAPSPERTLCHLLLLYPPGRWLEMGPRACSIVPWTDLQNTNSKLKLLSISQRLLQKEHLAPNWDPSYCRDLCDWTVAHS